MSIRKYIDCELLDYLAEWDDPIFNDITSQEYQEYRNRKEALHLYAIGTSHNEIFEKTKYNRNQIFRMINRCMSHDDDGKRLGYYGLIPNYQIKRTLNSKSISSIMEKHPELSEELYKKYFSRKSGPAITPSKVYVFKLFHKRLTELGYADDDYPKNLSDGGKRSFNQWLDRMEIEHNLYMARQSDNAKVHNKTTGVGDVIRRARRPYELIEIDGHRLDIIYSIPTLDKSGNTILIPATRPWIITAIDVYSRCIVGYTLCFRDEYNQYDIIRLIKDIIVPHDTLEGVRRDGFPSCVFEECRYAVPSIIALDNAMSHLANSIQDLTCRLGINLEYGPVDSPDRRPHIERLFGTLETKWLHLIPSTTGSNTNDIKRLKPEADSANYCITRDVVINVIERAIADYNNSDHSTLWNMTPMDYLSKDIRNGITPNRLPEIMRKCFHINVKRSATIRGNSKAGRRPYIQVFNHKYVFDIDSSSYCMIGMPVVIEFNPDDIRMLAVFDSVDADDENKFDRSKHRLPKGQFIGFAKMVGEDADRPLSIENYTVINNYKNMNKDKQISVDSTTNYIENLKNRNDKKSLKELENIAATLGDNYQPSIAENIDNPIYQTATSGESFNEILDNSINYRNERNEEIVDELVSYDDLRRSMKYSD